MARLRLRQSAPIQPLQRNITDYQVGREDLFTVLDIDRKRPFTVEAVLRKVSPHAYFYVQQGASVSGAQLDASAKEFEERILPSVRRLANPDWDPGAGLDTRVTILHARIPAVAGYYSFSDLLPAEANRSSNERPIIYVSLDALQPGSASYYSVLTHEFQHAAQAQADSNETAWVQEGASELVADLSGYPTGLTPFFINEPDTPADHLGRRARGDPAPLRWGPPLLPLPAWPLRRRGCGRYHHRPQGRPG